MQHPLDLVRGDRPREVEALCQPASEALEPLCLLGGLHTLGDEPQPERLAHPDDRLRECGPARILGHVVDEQLVDLEDVQGQILQGRQGGVAGPEVVHGDAHSERLQLAQACPRALRVVDHEALGDLQRQMRRRKPDRVRIATPR